MGHSRLYSAREVAEYMAVPLKQVYAAIRRGEIAATRIGRHYRVSGESVNRFLALNSNTL